MFTKQETFDMVLTGLREQGTLADLGDYTCVFRTLDGRKCAVGMLMADEDYNPDFDTFYVSTLVVWKKCPSLQKHDYDVLLDLQLIHDKASSMKLWEERMKEYAAEHGLKYAAP